MAEKPKNQPAGGTEPPEEKVTVSKSALEGLLKKLESLEEGQRRIEAAADLGRLEGYDAKRRKLGPRRYRLTVYDGKLVTGWRTVKDQKWMDGNVMRVQQEYEIIFGDNTKMPVNGYDNFANVLFGFRVVAEFVKEEADVAGRRLTLKIVGVPDEANAQGPEYDKAKELFGKEVVMDERFVN